MNQEPSNEAAPKGPESGGQAGPQSQSSELHAPLSITRQYIKDLSFENPNAPIIYSAYRDEGPELKVSVDIAANPLEDKSHEVVLSLNVSAKFQETVAFIVELSYAAQTIVDESLSQEKLERALMVEVPRFLFPFLRNIVANTTRDGGFPPLLLSPINFGRLHDNRQRKQADPSPGET